MVTKVDSNTSSLSFSEEASLGVLAGSPVWYDLEPNSYKNWGGTYTSAPRNPITFTRQRRKGSIVDLKVEGGYSADLTHNSGTRLMQGVLFADIREKITTAPMNSAAIPLTAITTTQFQATGVMPAFIAKHIVFAENCGVAANNGIHLISAKDADSVTTTGLSAEAGPPAAASITAVGMQGATGDITFLNAGGIYPSLNSTAFDFTTLGLLPGEWLFVGGDDTATHSATAANNGFCRIYSVAAHKILMDKTSGLWVTDTAAAKTMQLFFGRMVKNESTSNLIKRRTYQFERTLGNDGGGTGAEYMLGAVANEYMLTVKAASKVAEDFSFVAIDNQSQIGSVGLKAGTHVVPAFADCFNTSSDVVRMNMHVVSTTNPDPTPVFAYLMDLTMTCKNNVTENKAVGILGSFDTTAGSFDLTYAITAYLNSVDAVNSVRDNDDFSVDIIFVKANRGMVFDAPLLSVGGGLANVVQDKPIEFALSADAAMVTNGYTMMFIHFPYLPNLA